MLACAAASSFLFAAGLPNEIFAQGLAPLGYLALVPLYFALGAAPSYGFAALACALYGGLHHALSSYWLFYFKDFALYTIGATTIAYTFLYAVLGMYLTFFLKKSGKFRPLGFALVWAGFEYLKSTSFLGYPWGLLPYTHTEVLTALQIADITGIYGISFVLAFANAVIAESLFAHGASAVAAIPPLYGLPHFERLSRFQKWRQNRIAGSAKRNKENTGKRSSFGKTATPSVRARAGQNLPFSASLTLGYGLSAIGILAILFGYGAIRLAIPIPEKGYFNALIVQQNKDPWSEGSDATIAANIALARDALAKESRADEKTPGSGREPDLILFSESSVSAPFRESRELLERHPSGDPLLPFIRESGTYFFFGSPNIISRNPFQATNSVFLVGPDAEIIDDYAKIQLVPFAEVIPFWEYAWFRKFMQNVIGLGSGWSKGDRFTIFTLPTRSGEIKFGAPICFEDAWTGICREFALRGADIFINLTNDSWSRTVSAEVQHFAAARFRSIEFRKPMIRSTNGGVSCVLGPYGEVRASLPLFEPRAEIFRVPLMDTMPPTLYQRFGDWFAQGTLLLSAIWAIILVMRNRGAKRRRT